MNAPRKYISLRSELETFSHFVLGLSDNWALYIPLHYDFIMCLVVGTYLCYVFFDLTQNYSVSIRSRRVRYSA